MKYDKRSFLAGLTVGMQLKGWASVGGIGGKEPVAYLYNGVRLPKLPEWDKEKYPYIVIDNSYYIGEVRPSACELYALREMPTLLNPGYGDIDGFLFDKFADHVYCRIENDVWGAFKTSGMDETTMFHIIWTNFDLYYEDGTLHMAASEPVPVYE